MSLRRAVLAFACLLPMTTLADLGHGADLPSVYFDGKVLVRGQGGWSNT